MNFILSDSKLKTKMQPHDEQIGQNWKDKICKDVKNASVPWQIISQNFAFKRVKLTKELKHWMSVSIRQPVKCTADIAHDFKTISEQQAFGWLHSQLASAGIQFCLMCISHTLFKEINICFNSSQLIFLQQRTDCNSFSAPMQCLHSQHFFRHLCSASWLKLTTNPPQTRNTASSSQNALVSIFFGVAIWQVTDCCWKIKTRILHEWMNQSINQINQLPESAPVSTRLIRVGDHRSNYNRIK